MIRARLCLLLLAATACVHRVETTSAVPKTPAIAAPPVTPVDRTIHYPPVEIRPTPQEVAITDLDDEALFTRGMSAMAGGDNARAVLHFERLADFFPESTHRPQALYNAGILLMRMRDWAGAVGRFTDAVKSYGPATPEGLEARFRVADAYYFLGEVDAAVNVLEQITLMPEAPPVKHVEAATKRAVCLFNAGRLVEAEDALRQVVNELKDLSEFVRDGYLPSQAQFYLAEITRQQFLDAKLDPSKSTKEELVADLEFKAQQLLNAQGHYLRCIRLGHAEWATASGYRIGELYQKLYDQMIAAPMPQDLDDEQRAIYLEELHGRVRVLVDKAIHIYEKTLATADRVGATNPFVAQTREQLDKLKLLLMQKDAAKTSPNAPNEAPAKPPDHG